MRALVVTELRLQQLDRNVHGVYQRFGMLLAAIAACAAEVDVLCLNPDPEKPAGAPDDAAATELLKHWGVRVRVLNGSSERSKPLRPWMLQQLRWTLGYRHSHFYAGLDNAGNRQVLAAALATQPDVVLAHKLPAMEFVRARVPATIPILFDLDDVEDVAFLRQLERYETRRDRWVARAVLPGIRRAMNAALHRARHTFVCSNHDAVSLRKRFALPEPSVVVVPNSCVMQVRQAVVNSPTLLFVGTLSWLPNAEAIDFFISRCWPDVQRQVPEARLLVVGRNPELVPAFHHAPQGVEFLGFVDDIEVVYRQARVVICPVLSGGGTRVKLVEAAAFGKPIVSTHLGAEGLDFSDGVHALLRDSPQDFLDACVVLLSDHARCEELSGAVYAYAQKRFARSAVKETLTSVIAMAAASSMTDTYGYTSE